MSVKVMSAGAVVVVVGVGMGWSVVESYGGVEAARRVVQVRGAESGRVCWSVSRVVRGRRALEWVCLVMERR